MKQSMQLKLSQQLTMTPQLQQAIKLLQLSTIDLKAEIQTALESNPMLDIIDDMNEGLRSELEPESDTNQNEDSNEFQLEWNSSGPNYKNSSGDQFDYISQLHTKCETLHEHLMWQIQLAPLSDTDKAIAANIIDSISDDGYFKGDLVDIQSSLLPKHDASLDEIEAILHYIQHIDPVGVGARNIQECLLLQLNVLPQNNYQVAMAQNILTNHFDLLSNKNYNLLMRKLKLSEKQLQIILQMIQSLNPRPGSQISPNQAEYIYPDVIVSKRKNKWVVELNPESMPKIKINNQYASMVKRADKSTDNIYLRSQLQEARWLLKSIESRNETLLKVASCIVEYQKGFFELGEEAMVPLVLYDIAQAVDMHESTISRVTTQKYMHTPRGIYELKYFFSSHVETQTGGECSSTAIRALIKKLIAEENSLKPLSDNKIAILLQEKGIQVARRTIAKYRESLKIPSSSERKHL